MSDHLMKELEGGARRVMELLKPFEKGALPLNAWPPGWAKDMLTSLLALSVHLVRLGPSDSYSVEAIGLPPATTPDLDLESLRPLLTSAIGGMSADPGESEYVIDCCFVTWRHLYVVLREFIADVLRGHRGAGLFGLAFYSEDQLPELLGTLPILARTIAQ